MAKKNPHCPIEGCKAKQPHTSDPLVQMLVDRFAAPDRGLHWIWATLSEIRDSMKDDAERQRPMAFLSRMRIVEEVYFRTLHILFIEISHLVSGANPNEFKPIYTKVNAQILKGKGLLTSIQSGFGLPNYTPMDLLHSSAHGDFG
jgi:hypothetical protein